MADDDALQAALAQFNDGLKIQQAEEAAERAVGKAERKKQQAAADLKKLQGDPNASAEDKAAADEAYRAAVDEFNRLRSGEAPADTPEGADEHSEDSDAEAGEASEAADDAGEVGEASEAAEAGAEAEAEDTGDASEDAREASAEADDAGESSADAAEEAAPED